MKRRGIWVAAGVILLLAAALRAVGLYRGLADMLIWHPDVAKQHAALAQYLAGRYVWYVGSWYYDGYPLFLNHLDEWILRGLWLVARPIAAWLSPAAVPLAYPSGQSLYYWMTTFRLLYALGAVVVTWRAARRLLGEPPALWCALFVAVSPLLAAVGHLATGDVGVDLFGAVVLLVLAAHARRPHWAWFLAAGVLGGLTFAAKYQGLLVMLAVGGVLAFERTAGVACWKSVLARGALATVGLVAGALAGTPALLLDTRRAWRAMWQILMGIRNYQVPPELAGQGLAAQAGLGLRQNLGPTLAVLGLALTALALLGLLLALARLWRANPRRGADRAEARRLCVLAGVGAYPFAALALSLAGKPSVQPFHFSYLVIPLAIAAAYAAAELVRARRRFVRAAGVAGVALLLLESAWTGRAEVFFWRHTDTQAAAGRLAAEAFRGMGEARIRGSQADATRVFSLERRNLAVFRNRPAWVAHPDADVWRTLAAAPVPAVAAPAAADWVFLQGPVFPRNDHLFRVAPGGVVRRFLVCYGAPPSRLRLGVRAGHAPTVLSVSAGGEGKVLRLGRSGQAELELDARVSRRVAGAAPDGGDVFLVPLTVHVAPGPAWIAMFANEPEAQAFRWFGGGSLAGVERVAALDASRVAAALEPTRYLEGAELIPLRAGEGAAVLSPRGTALAAGAYELELVVRGGAQGARLRAEVNEHGRAPEHSRRQAGLWELQQDLAVTAGVQVLTVPFVKPPAPYEVDLALSAAQGDAELLEWRLRPDAERLLGDFAAFAREGAVPEWFEAGPATPVAPETIADGLAFGGRLRLRSFRFPAEVSPGVVIQHGLRFELLDARTDVDRLAVFVHVVDAGRRTVAAFDYPLSLAAFGDEPLAPLEDVLPADLPPGDYGLEVGVYEPTLGERLRPRLAPGAGFAVKRRAVRIQSLTVRAP